MGRILRQKNVSSMGVTIGIAFLAVTCLYVLFFIYPSYRALCQSKQAVIAQTVKLERMKVLSPVFTKSKILDQNQFEYRLPFPRRGHLHRNELSKLSVKISEIAKYNHMTMSGSDFDIESLKNPSQSVSMVIKLHGKLFDFRQFMIDIIAIEFFSSIEKLCIEANEGKMKNFTVNFGIKIKKNRS